MKSDLFTQDHYRVLGVARDAKHSTIREAYLKLVKIHHPDVSKGAESEEKFKAIASAWEASQCSAGHTPTAEGTRTFSIPYITAAVSTGTSTPY